MSMHSALIGRVAVLNERIAELETALRPFGDDFKTMGMFTDDYSIRGTALTWGDFRRADAVLAKRLPPEEREHDADREAEHGRHELPEARGDGSGDDEERRDPDRG